jgi:hypothetical protein
MVPFFSSLFGADRPVKNTKILEIAEEVNIILPIKKKKTRLEAIQCLQKSFSNCNIQVSANKMNEIMKIVDIENLIIPSSIKDISFKSSTSNKVISPVDDKNEKYKSFISLFQRDLLGFVNNTYDKPLMRAFVPGGFGLSMLFEHRYNKKDKIRPGDLDITVSINDSLLSAKECKRYLINKCTEFVNNDDDPSNYKMSVIDFKENFNSILGMSRFTHIALTYKGDDLIDFVITDRKIDNTEIDKEVSNKCGLPIKKEIGYLFEYFKIIYMENVPGVDNYCYLKRNPVTGKFSCKGQKDIERVKLLCKYSKNILYQKYCKMVRKLNIENLKRMTKAERDEVFLELRQIL